MTDSTREIDSLGRLIAAERNALTAIEVVKTLQSQLGALQKSINTIEQVNHQLQQKNVDLEQKLAVLQGHQGGILEKIAALEEFKLGFRKVMKEY